MSPFLLRPAEAFGMSVCRLGLASHLNTSITADDVHDALGRGVNFLNCSGLAEGEADPDAFANAIGELGSRRGSVAVCVQFAARTAADSAVELRALLKLLRTDYIDVLTLYFVEEPGEWSALSEPSGALVYLQSAKRDGAVRRIGVTSHQRPLAAEMARSGAVDALMIRYNAAHRGAEQDIFPTTDALRIPVIAYTATRWGALVRPTPDDPPDFAAPRAPDWYRFVLQSPSVAVVLAAPHSRRELEEDLEVLDTTGPMPEADYARLAEHGERVRRHAGHFV